MLVMRMLLEDIGRTPEEELPSSSSSFSEAVDCAWESSPSCMGLPPEEVPVPSPNSMGVGGR
jgi:hypothetical protein